MSAPPPYAELAACSNFSFLRGASHGEEMVRMAARLGLYGLALCDRNSLAGVVRAHMAARDAGVRFAVGCRLVFADLTPDIFVWPRDRAAYGRLCELLSLGKGRAQKGACRLWLDDLLAHGEGMVMAVHPGRHALAVIGETVTAFHARFGDAVHLGLVRPYGADDQRRMAGLAVLARQTGVALLALGDVLYHTPARRPLQDVLTCIREHETLATIGTRLEANAERHLRAPGDMARLFAGYEAALARTVTVFDGLRFSLDELRYQYPGDPVLAELGNKPLSSQEALERLTEQGLARRYPDGAPKKVKADIDHELDLIARLDYAPYFLTVYDIVRFARAQGILCQGRGSAANSAVCYCLGITDVDPDKVDLLFERFISEERNEPPDIDVDFEHERREEVIQYIYAKYGRDRAGLAATVVTYRSRSAIREVGKVYGLSDDAITAISGTKWGSHSREISHEDAEQAGLDPSDKHLAQMLDIASQIIGFPRHLSQHVGGFVITRDRLSSLIPIENAAMEDRTIVEWDKDDLECLGMLKIDILALGMLTCIRKSFDLLASHYDRHETLASIPAEDVATYDMICRADTVGVFQIESRAQMSMLPRLRPRTYYDLVIEVAIVRPGPIQGDMVHPYLRRRQGLEPVEFPSRELEGVLGKTLGVPLFQEQAMNIAIVAAGFTPGEADKLRRAMATFRRMGTIGSFRDKMVEGMVARGYERAFAEHCFRQIEGFGEYGFPESHAASFALLTYVSCWLKCRYPDVFCAAMLNSQPLGFYAPAQLIRDAREHGVVVRDIDVNFSEWDALLEPGAGCGVIDPRHREMAGVMHQTHAVRLGFRQIKGVREADIAVLVARRGDGYDSVRDLWLRTGLSRKVVERLARADCFGSIGLDRRAALWAAKALDPAGDAHGLALFAHAGMLEAQRKVEVTLQPMPLGEQVINDYQTLAYSLKAHPIGFLRAGLLARGYVRSVDLTGLKTNRRVEIAGLVLVRQRPGSARGVIFATLEDETGVANIIVWPKTFEAYRKIILGSRCIGVRGRLQNEQGVIHVVADRLVDLTPMLYGITEMEAVAEGVAGAGEIRQSTRNDGAGRDGHPRSTRRLRQLFTHIAETGISANPRAVRTLKPVHSVLPKGRNFH